MAIFLEFWIITFPLDWYRGILTTFLSSIQCWEIAISKLDNDEFKLISNEKQSPFSRAVMKQRQCFWKVYWYKCPHYQNQFTKQCSLSKWQIFFMDHFILYKQALYGYTVRNYLIKRLSTQLMINVWTFDHLGLSEDYCFWRLIKMAENFLAQILEKDELFACMVLM